MVLLIEILKNVYMIIVNQPSNTYCIHRLYCQKICTTIFVQLHMYVHEHKQKVKHTLVQDKHGWLLRATKISYISADYTYFYMFQAEKSIQYEEMPIIQEEDKEEQEEEKEKEKEQEEGYTCTCKRKTMFLQRKLCKEEVTSW